MTPDATIHVVLCDHGRTIGQVFAERDPADCDADSTVHDILSGQIEGVVAVYAFNPTERWSQDVSEDIAREIAACACDEQRPISSGLRDFIEQQAGLQATRGLRVDDGTLYGAVA